MNQESFYWLVRQELPSHLLTCLLTRPCRRQLQREAWQHYLPVKLSLTFLCHLYYYVYINVYYPQHNFIYLYLSHSPQSSQHPLTSAPWHSHKYNLLCRTLDTKTFSQSPCKRVSSVSEPIQWCHLSDPGQINLQRASPASLSLSFAHKFIDAIVFVCCQISGRYVCSWPLIDDKLFFKLQVRMSTSAQVLFFSKMLSF